MNIINDYKELYPAFQSVEAPEQLRDLYNKYLSEYGSEYIV